MKDIDTQNEVVLEGKWEEFDTLLAKHDYTNARLLMENVGDNGWENDALRMHHLINEAEQEPHYEPIEDSEIPFITPEEDDAPVFVGVNFDRDAQYDKN